MNYSLNDIPDSGKNTVVYMDISLKADVIGRIYIQLFRDVFPAGVENFIGIARGTTYKVNTKGVGRCKYVREHKRTYEGCKFYHMSHNNYVVSGDIYNNTGKTAGTIYCDQPIPADFGDFFIRTKPKG